MRMIEGLSFSDGADPSLSDGEATESSAVDSFALDCVLLASASVGTVSSEPVSVDVPVVDSLVAPCEDEADSSVAVLKRGLPLWSDTQQLADLWLDSLQSAMRRSKRFDP